MGRQYLLIEAEPTEERHRYQFGLVARHLPKDQVVWLDPPRAPLGPGLSFEHAGGRSHVVYGDKALDPNGVCYAWGLPRTTDRVLEEVLSERLLEGVLRPMFPLHKVASQLDAACSAVSGHVRALCAEFPGALLLNDPRAADHARHKPSQLRLAGQLIRELELEALIRVPDTVQTNDPVRAERSIAVLQSAGGCVMKSPVQIWFPTPSGGEQLLFTTEIRPGDELVLEALRQGPMIFQQKITGKDVRVTVVGRKVFAGKIIPRGGDVPDFVCDYRAGRFRIEGYELPDAVAGWCVALVKALGLLHGDLDFRVNEQGVWWFFEVQDGMWGMLESQTGQPVGEAFAELLLAA